MSNNLSVSDVATEAGTALADQAVELAVSESKLITRFKSDTNTIPLYTARPNAHLIGWVTEWDAHCRLKKGVATLSRDGKGRDRRIYLAEQAQRALLAADERPLNGIGALRQSSRTVRRESVGDIYSTYSHITNDLALKRQITNEELLADSILPKGGK